MILIVDKQKANARQMCEIFHYMGILSYYATPSEIYSELDNRYSAVLFYHPESFAYDTALAFVRDLPFYIGCFAISDAAPSGFDSVFPTASLSSAVYLGIRDFLLKSGKRSPSEYTLSGIDASSERPYASYFGKKISLTKTEFMILRYLIRAYPTVCSPRCILQHAFKPTRLPEPASVRTHIFSINKKFSRAGVGKIISYIDGSGYSILTPELSLRLAEASI